MLKIQVTRQGKSSIIIADSSKTLAQNLFVQRFFKGIPLCSGIGTCGQCAVRFLTNPPQPSLKDNAYFSHRELSQGLRLGCTHCPEPGQSVELLGTEAPGQFSWKSREVPEYLGIDIGTSSIRWGFLHQDGQISHGQAINPQIGAGPDIMSRLSFARESTRNYNLLNRLLVEEVQSILDLYDLPDNRICISGNPAMLYFLLGRNISGLSVSPYFLDYEGGVSETLGDKPVNVFIPSLCSPFVGGDISAGLTWILEKIQPACPFLLADFGTNGELVLALSPDKYISTSVALGPALEGIGLKSGSLYREGVASGFEISSLGIEPRDSWHTGKVSGSGYISLLGHLIRLKLVSPSGHFVKEGLSPIAKNISTNIKEGRLSLGGKFYLDGRDIEEILKVKAAFTLGFSFLCAQGDILPDKLKSIYIAGALGKHSNLIDLETLGFFPPGSSHKSHVVGNTSLKGAILLAGDRGKRHCNIALGRLVESVNLGSRTDYISGQFAGHMLFEYPR